MNISKLVITTLMFLTTAVSAPAQQIDIPASFTRLAAAAKDKVEVNLDTSTLKFASAFLSEDREETAAKKVIEGLKGVFVRVFEFDRDGAYSDADVQPIVDQLKGAAWQRIVTVKEASSSEEVGVWMHREGEKTTGMVVLVTEPREITFVNLVGPIRPEDLATIGGQLGIPNIGGEKKE